MIFDTHAHYDDEAFDEDREELLSSLPEAGIKAVVNVGASLESTERSLGLAARYPFVYAAVGVHPSECGEMKEEDIRWLKKASAEEKAVAVGEIGLDYHYDFSPRAVQQDVLRRQMRLAQKVDLPIVFHDREAHADSLAICREIPVRGVFHCFSGSLEMAKELAKRGWHLGFDGPITYKNARKALEVLEWCPLERILIETDSPYLTPVPFRGKRNDSGKLRYIVEKIAEIKGLSHEDTARATAENARRLFL